MRFGISALLPLPVLLYLNPPAVLAAMLGAGIVHEMGHLLCALCQKRRVRALEVSFFGAQFVLEEKLCSYGADLLLHLAGPAANFAAALFCLALVRQLPYSMHFFCLYLNAAFTLFHLLPIEGMDGGAALFSILCARTDPQRAHMLCRRTGFITLLVLSALCTAALIQTGFHLSLLFAAVFLLAFLLRRFAAKEKSPAPGAQGFVL